MLATKKNWERPKLIILERGRPEELVLAGCKTSGLQTKAKTKHNGCAKGTAATCPANPCSANTPS
jgi:hypothetical protein